MSGFQLFCGQPLVEFTFATFSSMTNHLSHSGRKRITAPASQLLYLQLTSSSSCSPSLSPVVSSLPSGNGGRRNSSWSAATQEIIWVFWPVALSTVSNSPMKCFPLCVPSRESEWLYLFHNCIYKPMMTELVFRTGHILSKQNHWSLVFYTSGTSVFWT